MNVKDYIASIPNFPQEPVIFRDITPLLADGHAFRQVCDLLIEYAKKTGAELVVAPESRGYFFGSAISYELEIGCVPVRKPGKLPRETISESYDLEYGSNTLEMHKDAIKPGQKVLIVDDLLATGGTVEATCKLVERLGGIVVGIAFIIELPDLHGRDLLSQYDIYALCAYEGE